MDLRKMTRKDPVSVHVSEPDSAQTQKGEPALVTTCGGCASLLDVSCRNPSILTPF